MSTPRRTYYLALARRARALRATRRRTHERSFAPALGSEASGVLEPGLAFPRKRRRPPFPLPSGWDEETSLDPPGAGRGSRALSISRRDPGLPTPLAAAAALQLYSCRRGSHLAVATLLPFSWRRFFSFFLGSSGFPLFFLFVGCRVPPSRGQPFARGLPRRRRHGAKRAKHWLPLSLEVGEKRRRGRGRFLLGRAASRGPVLRSNEAWFDCPRSC